ncbi:MAG TPA: anthranilate phosphoribosyltransferase [Sphingomicrobium sp.]
MSSSASITVESRPDDGLDTLFDGRDISLEQSRAFFSRLVAGDMPEPIMAAAFVCLRLKGETSDELTGGALALREATRAFAQPDGLFADSCGTGGDGSGSINVSTAAGLVAAACGLPIVKHGNRSITSKCGSADVLEALGAKLDVLPEKSREIYDETGFCFLLAPLYHPGIAHAGPVRRALKVRTIMNLLGPCLNPARPPVQLLGVAEPKLMRPIAETLLALGVERGLVVHGSGLDEVAPHAETQAIRISDGVLEDLLLTPEQAGLERRPLEQIAGGCPEDNAERLAALLHGRGTEGDAGVVALNAGALLWAAGVAPSFADGVTQASDAMSSGRAGQVLDRFVEASNG